ncbi:HlyD family secretion protein [Parasalinivibrio latis]|uniref:HlyD family secretion protein n=1 Tax=Parasalinivibrio latis TaxID=2952610 RepID=UPI0030E455A0
MSTKTSSSLKNGLLLLVVIAVLGVSAYFYIRHQEKYPSTDDAYIHANILYVAPQISGQLTSVTVSDYQAVDKGDVLARIDPAPYRARLDQAQAAYELATQANKASDDAIIAASADIRSAMAQLEDVQQKYHRTMTLVNKGIMPKQAGDDAKAQLASAKNNLDASRARMSQLVKEQGAKGTAAPQVKQAAAALSEAALNLSYTEIVAPDSGVLGKVNVRPGSVVAPGQSLMPLVESDTFWVQANFKEDDLEHIRSGMPADVVLDMYPDTTFVGYVEAISPASGSSFSLLPPENATGNWVKVPQRFPVRIALKQKEDEPQLRVGASSTVVVDTVAQPAGDTTTGSK